MFMVLHIQYIPSRAYRLLNSYLVRSSVSEKRLIFLKMLLHTTFVWTSTPSVFKAEEGKKGRESVCWKNKTTLLLLLLPCPCDLSFSLSHKHLSRKRRKNLRSTVLWEPLRRKRKERKPSSYSLLLRVGEEGTFLRKGIIDGRGFFQ